MRTFKQLGLANGIDPLHVVAKIDGKTIFDGNIDTVPTVKVFEPGRRYGEQLFTWQTDIMFAGSQRMEIVVDGSDFGMLILTELLANCSRFATDQHADPENSWNLDIYQEIIDHPKFGKLLYSDPKSNVRLDGILLPHEKIDPMTGITYGQYYWHIPVGSTFSATINVSDKKTTVKS